MSLSTSVSASPTPSSSKTHTSPLTHQHSTHQGNNTSNTINNAKNNFDSLDIIMKQRELKDKEMRDPISFLPSEPSSTCDDHVPCPPMSPLSMKYNLTSPSPSSQSTPPLRRINSKAFEILGINLATETGIIVSPHLIYSSAQDNNGNNNNNNNNNNNQSSSPSPSTPPTFLRSPSHPIFGRDKSPLLSSHHLLSVKQSPSSSTSSSSASPNMPPLEHRVSAPSTLSLSNLSRPSLAALTSPTLRSVPPPPPSIATATYTPLSHAFSKSKPGSPRSATIMKEQQGNKHHHHRTRSNIISPLHATQAIASKQLDTDSHSSHNKDIDLDYAFSLLSQSRKFPSHFTFSSASEPNSPGDSASCDSNSAPFSSNTPRHAHSQSAAPPQRNVVVLSPIPSPSHNLTSPPNITSPTAYDKQREAYKVHGRTRSRISINVLGVTSTSPTNSSSNAQTNNNTNTSS